MLSVALLRQTDTLPPQITEQCERSTHAGTQRVLPWIETLLAESAFPKTALDGIAFGHGPGSFTGIRLACAVAQGLALGLDIPVVGIDSLHALALAIPAPRVLACLDARMNEVYFSAYERSADARLRTLCPPTVASPEALCVQFAALCTHHAPLSGWTGCGDGFSQYAQRLPALSRIHPVFYPKAADVGRLALDQFRAGQGRSPCAALPFYVRNKVALTLEEQHARRKER